jgi:hypothetical protein
LTKTQQWELVRDWLLQLKAKLDQQCTVPYFPAVVITDQGQNEINAIQYAFDFVPRMFYCAWHVLHAWERNLTNENLGMNGLSSNEKKDRKAKVSQRLFNRFLSILFFK